MSSELVAGAAPAGAGRGSVRELGALAYPVVLTQLSQTLMMAIDSAMVGRLGATELASTGFGGIWIWTVSCLFMGTATGVQTFVSQDHGAGREARCGRWVWQAAFAVMPAYLLVVLLFGVALGPLLAVLGPSAAMQAATPEYVLARLPGMPAMVGCMLLASFFRGLGDTRTPLYVTLGATALNAGLDWLLIFGHLGFPALGVRGAGIATSVAEWAYLVVILALFLGSRSSLRWHTGPARPARDEIRRYLRTSAPIGGQWVLDMGAFAVFSTLVARMGDAQMAANQALINLLMFSFMLVFGISIACSTLVGRYKGAGDLVAAERSYWNALRLGIGLAGAMSVLFLALPEPLFRIFTDDEAVLSLSGSLMGLAAAFLVVDAVAVVVGGALRGAGDTRWPFLVQTLLAWGLRVPLAWLLGVTLGWGVVGAWSGELIFIWVLGVAFALRFRGGAWKTAAI